MSDAPPDASPAPGAPYGALALDLDGTLLSGNNRVEPETAALLARAARSFPVCIVTGRMEAGALAAWRACSLSTPMVSYNGAKVGVPGEPPMYRAGVSPEATARVHALAAERGWHVNYYVGDELLVLADTPAARWYAGHYGVPFRVVDAAAILDGPPAYKLLVIVPPEEHPAAWDALVRLCPPDLGHLTPSSDVFVEILPPGCDKGGGLARLADALGIPPERWVAVGDAPNDREMLAIAGLGVAVANGHPSIVAAADRVVAPLWPDGLPRLLADAFDFA